MFLRHCYIVLFLSLIPFINHWGQEFTVIFYNVENLFDTQDDPLVDDDSFLPKGDRYWTDYKYQKKLDGIAKVLAACSAWGGASVICLAEIENRKVINDLLTKTLLKETGYHCVHYESPDRRGIDLAFLYRSEDFHLLESAVLPYTYPKDPKRKSRDILHVKGIVLGLDTVHFFVNHWPSRWGGYLESEPYRLQAARLLKEAVAPLILQGKHVLITGDFNDSPSDKSIREILDARQPATGGFLDNYMWDFERRGVGTYFYQGKWNCLDQFLSSPSLHKEGEGKIYIAETGICKQHFFMEKDRHSPAYIPFRTYRGYRYIGGFSDHFPIILKLVLRE